MRCEKCGFETNAEVTRLLAELRQALRRLDPSIKVALSWPEAQPASQNGSVPRGASGGPQR